MAIELNTAGDFAAVVDGSESVTLKRRESAATVGIERATRTSSHTAEAAPTGGHAAQADVVWQFAWSDWSAPPRLGDVLIDSQGECFTVLVVEERRATGRVRCEARNLRIVYQLTDRVDVQKAIWQDTGGGPEIAGWTTVRTAVLARVQPERLEVDRSESPPTGKETYRIALGEQLSLDADTRFVDAQGTAYELIDYTQAERIDALPVARVVKS